MEFVSLKKWGPCIYQWGKYRKVNISGKLLLKTVHTGKCARISSKKAFPRNANRPFADRRMGDIVNKFEHVRKGAVQ